MGGGKNKEPKPDWKAMQAASAKVGETPVLQQKLDVQTQGVLDYINRSGEFSGKPLDITALPGLGNYQDIYGNAEALAARKRVGNPMAAFSEGAHPGFAKQLEQQNAMERYGVRAAGLSSAADNIVNQARAAAGQSVNWDMDRRARHADLLAQASRDYYARPKEPALWEKIAGIAVGGLGAATGTGGLFGAAKGLFGGK